MGERKREELQFCGRSKHHRLLPQGSKTPQVHLLFHPFRFGPGLTEKRGWLRRGGGAASEVNGAARFSVNQNQ